MSYSRVLLFLVAPKSVTITGVREAKVGETLTLTCTTTNSNPAAVITWIPRGTTLLHDSSHTVESPDGGYITISHINVTLTHQQNTAMYTCEALNVDLGVRRSATAIVGVLCKYCKIIMPLRITLSVLVGTFHLLVIFANSLDPDQDRHNVGPDLDPNCLAL